MDQANDFKQGDKGAWISIITYIILAVVKLIIASVGHSDALRADGLNNTTDVVASVAVLIGLKISRKPPDADHRYGHHRAETIASLFAAFVIVTVGIQVITESFENVLAGKTAQPGMLTGWTALGTAFLIYGVYLYNRRLATKIGSSSLSAAAKDNRSDAFVSVGAFVGISGAQFGIYWLDPLAGLIVGIIICKTAWDIFVDATHTLTDGFDETKIKQVKAGIADVTEVKKVVDVKGRIYGNQAFIDVTILVEPSLNVKESHAITEKIERFLQDQYNIPYAQIHIEPYE
ncbi:cation diffusion facilitator family transporter [Barrientosiimonas marina]|uniref:Cation diffusion facilitator family transporter n=1 Tax=Lentibacillus kimchii TaxID=1542911 RepID=A0ABW2UUH0_9BACI